jgi:hypothetical protein
MTFFIYLFLVQLFCCVLICVSTPNGYSILFINVRLRTLFFPTMIIYEIMSIFECDILELLLLFMSENESPHNFMLPSFAYLWKEN